MPREVKEVKKDNFLDVQVQQPTEHVTGLLRKDKGIDVATITVNAVNQSQLGFTLAMEIEESKYAELNEITFTPSQSIHRDFFHTRGVFWSTFNSVSVGADLVGTVSIQDAQAILLAEMSGINTMQLISDELQKPLGKGKDRTNQWQMIMSSLPPISL